MCCLPLQLHASQSRTQAPGHRFPCFTQVARMVVCLLPANVEVVSWLCICRVA